MQVFVHKKLSLPEICNANILSLPEILSVIILSLPGNLNMCLCKFLRVRSKITGYIQSIYRVRWDTYMTR